MLSSCLNKNSEAKNKQIVIYKSIENKEKTLSLKTIELDSTIHLFFESNFLGDTVNIFEKGYFIISTDHLSGLAKSIDFPSNQFKSKCEFTINNGEIIQLKLEKEANNIFPIQYKIDTIITTQLNHLPSYL